MPWTNGNEVLLGLVRTRCFFLNNLTTTYSTWECHKIGWVSRCLFSNSVVYILSLKAQAGPMDDFS